MYDLVPKKDLVKYGMQGIGGIAGGIVLMALQGLGWIPSLIIGGILAVTGLGISKSEEDRPAGLIVAAAGAITALTAVPLIGGIAGALMGVAGVGLLVAGGINAFKFIRGYLKRKKRF